MKTKAEIITGLGQYFADTLVECTDYVHDGTLTAEDVAKMIFDELEDWMETKIAQSEQSITSVVKSYMYDEIDGKTNGANDIDFNELIIGR
jgi:hypothetical protein